MKLFIEATFEHELTERAKAEVKQMVRDLQEELASCGGIVRRAELISESR